MRQLRQVALGGLLVVTVLSLGLATARSGRPKPPDPGALSLRSATPQARATRWIPLFIKSLILTILAGCLAWAFLPRGSALPATVVTASACVIWLSIRYFLDYRAAERAAADLRHRAEQWAAAQRAALEYGESVRQLSGAAEQVRREQANLDQALRRLEQVRGHVLDRAAAGLPSNQTAVTDPIAATLVGPGRGDVNIPVILKDGVAPEEVAQALLNRDEELPDLSPHARAELTRSLLAAATESPSPIRLLLPVRPIQPSSGKPVRSTEVVLSGARPDPEFHALKPEVWSGDDPFTLVRMALSQPFSLAGSARIDQAAGRREAS